MESEEGGVDGSGEVDIEGPEVGRRDCGRKTRWRSGSVELERRAVEKLTSTGEGDLDVEGRKLGDSSVGKDDVDTSEPRKEGNRTRRVEDELDERERSEAMESDLDSLVSSQLKQLDLIIPLGNVAGSENGLSTKAKKD